VSFINSQEFHTIKREIWTEKIYQISLDCENPIIIDVGAHIGISTLYFKRAYPDSTIFSFEPNAELYSLLKKNIEQNNLKEIHLFNFALSNKIGKSEFYIDSSEEKWYSTGSFNPKAWNNRQNNSKITVNTVNFRYIIDQIKQISAKSHINLLKIDVEGAEIKVLKDIFENYSDFLIKNIVVEAHPINNNVEKLKKLLRRCNYIADEAENGEGLIILKATRAKH